LLCAFVLGIVLWNHYKNKKSIIEQRNNNLLFSESYLKELIVNNKNILTVTDLADAINTSTVQLNRKLAKSNTSPLKLLKETKKEIAMEMYQKGASMESICKRVGYRERYIKKNFLKENPKY